MSTIQLLSAAASARVTDGPADTALRLAQLYEQASEYPDQVRAKVRLDAIVRAAHDANVWRMFVAARDGMLTKDEA